MKIVFDLTPIYDHLTGIERYNINISKCIIESHPENDYVLLFKNEIHKEFEGICKFSHVKAVVIPGCNKLVFIQFRLLKELKRIDADYYIFLSFTSPMFFKKKHIINAIHDLTCWDCPETIDTKMKYYYRLTYKAAVRNSEMIVTVSKFSQQRICKRYNLRGEQVPVIYDGLTDIFRNGYKPKVDIQLKYGLPEHYILSLSTIEPRKNLQLLISAYKELCSEGADVPALVLAGRKGWKIDKILECIPKEIQSKIYFTGFIDDEDLPQVYKRADLFVFPSKYEGFGLPPLEAMACGTIVLSSDAASLPEVLGEGAVYFNNNDKDDLKNKLIDALSLSQSEKENLRNNARRQIEKFKWDVEANKLYSLLINIY